MNAPSNPPAINDRLSLLLESTRQIAFDWSIADDRLQFRGESDGNFKGMPLDMMRTWRSSELPGIMHEEDRANFRMHLHQALKGTADGDGVIYRVELRLKDTVREWRWVDISGKVVSRDRHGRALRMVGAVSDIDERKRAERRSERLRDLYAALRQVNHAIMRFSDRDALFREICRIAVEHGRFTMAWIGLTDPGTQQILPVAFYGDERHDMSTMEGWSDHFALSPAGKRAAFARRDRAIICNDVEASPLPARLRATARQTGCHALASLPFQCPGQPAGVLNVYAPEKDYFDTSTIDLLEQLAKDMSFAVNNLERENQREQTEKALAASEQLKSAILTASLDCIISINQHGDIISFNQAAESTFGHAGEAVLGKPLADIIVLPEWRERHHQGVAHFLAAGNTTILNRRIELSAMRADGSLFPIELAIVPIEVHGTTVFTAFIRDISELKRSQEALKESAMRYRQLVELSPEAIVVHRDNKFVLLNQVAVRMLGAQDASELLGRDVFDFIHPDHHAVCRARIQTLRAGLDVVPPHEQVWLRLDGMAFDAEATATRVVYDDEAAIQAVVRDITIRKRAEQLQAGQNRILNMVATGVDLARILHEIALFTEEQSPDVRCAISVSANNGAALSIAAAPRLPDSCRHGLDGLAIAPSSASCGTAASRGEPVIVADIAESQLWTAHRRIVLDAGLKACSSWPVTGKNKKVLGTIALYFRDMREPSTTEQELIGICTNLAAIAIESRESEERIRYMAHYDGLTALPNRFLFKEFLDQALRNAQRNAGKFAVFFIDLDKFKDINDTLGHDAGDLVLRETADRLRRCVRQTDKIARMGGDEFYVLIENLEDGCDAADVAQKLLAEASRPIRIGQQECRLSASIGIGIYPDNGTTAQMLLKNADRAMYEVKKRGKDGYRFFDDTTAERAG